jgi:dihydropteroate synthase
MGVLNCTPDSFSDGGRYLEKGRAIDRALQLADEGADIVDIGGESTRPGSRPTPEEEELKRVIPVIEEVAHKIRVPVSIDTSKSRVAKEALDAGASMVNDISALTSDSRMTDLLTGTDIPVVLMHMKGQPEGMQVDPSYTDVMGEITGYLADRLRWCNERGIKNTLIDPGIGFGKRFQDNTTILKNLSEFRALGRPILVGTSRKSFIGKALDLPVNDRLEGTLASIAVAVLNGANVIRAHDVKEAIRVTKMVDSLR